MNNYVFFIGIAGGTGSGKTSIAKSIATNFSQSTIALIEQDSYYKDLSNITMKERNKINFDHPDSVDFELMQNHISALINGDEVEVPVYDFKRHVRTDKTVYCKGHHIILLEGILALYDEFLRNLMDIKIFVDTPDDIRILRRVKRDINKRGRTLESVMDQYYSTVRPMHYQFVEPTKKYADIIIPEGGQNKVAIDILRTKITSILLDYRIKTP